MGATVGDMTKAELEQMIEASVERKLLELLGDPDEGLVLLESVRERLLQQKEAVARGERGRALDEVVRELGREYGGGFA